MDIFRKQVGEGEGCVIRVDANGESSPGQSVRELEKGGRGGIASMRVLRRELFERLRGVDWVVLHREIEFIQIQSGRRLQRN